MQSIVSDVVSASKSTCGGRDLIGPLHPAIGAVRRLSRLQRQREPRKRCAVITLFALALSLVFFDATNGPAQAQGLNLFVPAQLADVTAAQTQRISQIRQRATTQSLDLVRADIDALRSDSTRILLPNGRTLALSRRNIEVRDNRNFTWTGELPANSGNATLVVHDGMITGTIRDDRDLYRVEPIEGNIHAVVKVDESRFPPDHPPSFQLRERRGDIRVPGRLLDSPRDNPSPVRVDVLVAHTTAARTAVTDITGTVQLAVAEANQSYQNSGINIRLNLVDSFEVSYSESGKTFDTILADFVAMTDVNTRRDISGADLSALIINQSDYCGLADTILAQASTAFAIVHYSCATGYYSFAHELGHLMGARHDEQDDSTTTPFAYGHGLRRDVAPSWRTIMAYNCPGGCPRLQYWSNPNVNNNGIPMGTAATNDNARVLNETAATIAAFRNPPGIGLPGMLMTLGQNADGRIEAFARGTDYAEWHQWQTAPNNGWSGWASMGGWIDRLIVGRNADGRLEIFARGSDGAVWHQWQTAPNNGWSGWASMGGWIDMLTVGNNADGRLEIFARGSDGAVWHQWQTAPNNGWSGWASMGGWIDMLTVGNNADGRLEVFARGSDGAVWHQWQTAPNNGWSGWASMGGWIDMLTVGNNADGRLEVFARGSDGAVWHQWQTSPNNGWSGWASMSGWIDRLAVGRNADGRLEVFARGSDAALWHQWQTAPNNGWSGWASMGGWIDMLTEGNNADGRLEIFARGSDRALWHQWQTAPNNGWSGWASLGGIID